MCYDLINKWTHSWHSSKAKHTCMCDVWVPVCAAIGEGASSQALTVVGIVGNNVTLYVKNVSWSCFEQHGIWEELWHLKKRGEKRIQIRAFSFPWPRKHWLLVIVAARISQLAQWWGICPPRQETWVPSMDWEDPLEKERATWPSILAWRIPRTEGPGGL